jgi:hypothetical protein
MKQYQHKATGVVFTQTKDGNFYTSDSYSKAKIPAALVEGSADYRDPNPLFTADDGVAIYDGDKWYYVVIGMNPIVRQTTTLEYHGSADQKRPVKRFATLQNANAFKELLNKRVSIYALEVNAELLGISQTSLELIKKHFVNK